MKEEPMREYGGYLPLELPYKRKYYHYDSNHMVKTNSGTTALCCALMAMKPKRFFTLFYLSYRRSSSFTIEHSNNKISYR